eukprot:1179311-Prorocentrum_minimum.AAC.9
MSIYINNSSGLVQQLVETSWNTRKGYMRGVINSRRLSRTIDGYNLVAVEVQIPRDGGDIRLQVLKPVRQRGNQPVGQCRRHVVSGRAASTAPVNCPELALDLYVGHRDVRVRAGHRVHRHRHRVVLEAQVRALNHQPRTVAGEVRARHHSDVRVHFHHVVGGNRGHRGDGGRGGAVQQGGRAGGLPVYCEGHDLRANPAHNRLKGRYNLPTVKPVLCYNGSSGVADEEGKRFKLRAYKRLHLKPTPTSSKGLADWGQHGDLRLWHGNNGLCAFASMFLLCGREKKNGLSGITGARG